MQKMLTGLSLALLMASGQAMADQSMLDALKALNVPLSEQQVAAIGTAEGEALIKEIVALVGANQAMAPTIVHAANCVAPELGTDITEQSLIAAPAQANAIYAAVERSCEDIPVPALGNSSIPSGGGVGGGVASGN
jgi:hypothetical protein